MTVADCLRFPFPQFHLTGMVQIPATREGEPRGRAALGSALPALVRI